MSEEAKEAPAGKKKGKLPVIIRLLALVGGGGFFGMKMKGGGPKKVEIKAAAETVPFDKEFLVNLNSQGGNTYLRAELSLELREGYPKESLDPSMPAIKDTVIKILRSQRLQDVSADKTDDLQHTIAVAINKILVEHMKPEEKTAQDGFEKEAASEAKSTPKADGGSSDGDAKESFTCPAGPVLNVYFTSFTTQ